jgi:diguanylate cyclase (GGDEF)-like protein
MKKLIPIFAILLGWAAAAWAEAPAPLTTLRAIHALTNAEASKELPVAFQATVTYYRGYETTLVVQDGDAGIYVHALRDAKLVPGDRVLIKGTTRPSFNPYIESSSITLLRHGLQLKPLPSNFDQMIRAQADCQLVIVSGMVHAADMVLTSDVRSIYLQLLTDGGYIVVTVDSDDASVLEGLLDAEVLVTGVASEEFDSKRQVTGIRIHVQTFAGIQVLKRAADSPWTLPVTSMERVLAVYHMTDSTLRVRVHGIITYYAPGSVVVLQDGDKSIWIATRTNIPLRIGDAADATGFPDAYNGFLTLEHGEIRDSLIQAPITPLPATWQILSPAGIDSSGHHFDLVSIEGKVVSQVRAATQYEYVLTADGKVFSAFLRRSENQVSDGPQIPVGSRIRVTGICIRENSNPYIPQVPFNILMRSFGDIEVIKGPSLLNIRNLTLIVVLLLAILALVGGWGWNLERNVRRQTAALAALERQRSRILVDINGSRPLAEILEKIVGMVSAMLDGATCWCELADGTTVGKPPQEPRSLEIVRVKIDARSGPALGALLAAFGPQSPPAAHRTEALADGVRLAALAIETRRLYSDLRHRSEFDLLTEIPNRFAMEKRMDILIEEARQNSGIFGLIYIDLDQFKPINDRYGHHIGDLYLQEVAVRMKRQLRGGDMLARLGGDEFAALVSVVRSRADVEEAAHRLERCFDTPFAVEEHSLWGEASIGIALYPEDGLTKDSLLNAADAAMYEVKNSRR